MLVRQFAFGRTLLMLIVSGPREGFPDEDAKRYLDSLKIVETREDP
jgi:hypothetical protein